MVDSPRFYVIHFDQFEAMDAKPTSQWSENTCWSYWLSVLVVRNEPTWIWLNNSKWTSNEVQGGWCRWCLSFGGPIQIEQRLRLVDFHDDKMETRMIEILWFHNIVLWTWNSPKRFLHIHWPSHTNKECSAAMQCSWKSYTVMHGVFSGEWALEWNLL